MTDRDVRILKFIGDFGFCNVNQISNFLCVSQKMTYKILNRISKLGLVENRRIFHGKCGLYFLTKQGCQFTETKFISHVKLGTLEHDLILIDTYVYLHHQYKDISVVTDRNIKMERIMGRKVHVPDLVLSDKSGHQFAVEVELSIKSHKRIKTITQFYKGATNYQEIWYFCNNKTYGYINRYITNNPIFKLFKIETIYEK